MPLPIFQSYKILLNITSGLFVVLLLLLSPHLSNAQNYKLIKAKDSVNQKASALLRQAFSDRSLSPVFGKSFICGPSLWAALSAGKGNGMIAGTDANFHIQQPDGSLQTRPGKIIQNITEADKLWSRLISQHSVLLLSAPTKAELVMYASLLAPEIHEPIYIVTLGRNRYLIHIDFRNYSILFLEKLNH